MFRCVIINLGFLLSFYSSYAHCLSFSDLKHAITIGELQTVEALQTWLPADFQKNYTLIHTSKSLQGATELKPRILYFGDDASLIIAVSGGEPSHPNYFNVETMEFDRRTSRFELREITFDPKGVLPPGISESNPAICVACHAQNAKPNWGTYPSWTGAYGSRDDFVDDLFSQTERKAFDEFKRKRSQYPRYSNLYLNPDSIDAPFSEWSHQSFPLRPNFRMGVHLATYQSEQIFRLLKEKPGYKESKYLVMMAALGCITRGSVLTPFAQERLKTLFGQDYTVEQLEKYDGGFETALFENLGISIEQFNLNSLELSAHRRVGKYHFNDGVATLVQAVATKMIPDIAAQLPEALTKIILKPNQYVKGNPLVIDRRAPNFGAFCPQLQFVEH